MNTQDAFYQKLRAGVSDFFATATKEEIAKSMEGIDFDSLNKLDFPFDCGVYPEEFASSTETMAIDVLPLHTPNHPVTSYLENQTFSREWTGDDAATPTCEQFIFGPFRNLDESSNNNTLALAA